jgi:hypothetical protein
MDKHSPYRIPSAGTKKFHVSYQDNDGSVLHGLVKQISNDDFQVYVQEKGVIIHCTRDEYGFLSCKLNTFGNPDWVDGISEEVAKELNSNSEE